MKKYLKHIILLSLLLTLDCTDKIDESYFFGQRISFSLSKTNAVVFEEVNFVVDNSETSGTSGFVLLKPDGAQEEFYTSRNLESYLDMIGTYTMYQVGYQDNAIKINISPNIVFYTSDPGNPINVRLTFNSSFSNIESPAFSTVNCVTGTAPDCNEYQDSNCGYFAVPPERIIYIYAEDGEYEWGGDFVKLGTINKGQCYSFILNRP